MKQKTHEISYRHENSALTLLGKSHLTPEEKLVIILDATTPEVAEQKIKALGTLNSANIYVDGKPINYPDLYKTLME